MKDTATQSFIPVKDIFDGIMVRDDGVLCAVVLVSAVNFNLKSDVEREAILHQFRSFLNSLEVDIQILIQSRRLNIKPYLDFLGRLYDTQQSDLLRLQTREYLSFIKDFTDKNEIMTKQFFIIISYSPIQSDAGMSFFKKNTEERKRIFEEDRSQLLQRVSFVQNNIRSLGFGQYNLVPKRSLNFCIRPLTQGRHKLSLLPLRYMALLDFLKPKKEQVADAPDSFIPKEFFATSDVGFRDVVAPSAVQVTPKHLLLGSRFVRSFAVVSYPRFLAEGWFSPIVNLSKEFDISIFVHPMDSKEVLRKFRRKVAQVESQIIERERKGMVRDPKLDTAHQDLETLRDNIQQATERLFEVGVYISIYGDTLKELDEVERDIRSLLESGLIFVKPVVFQQEQGLKSVSPFGTDLLSIHTKLNSDPLSSFFPFVSFDLSSEKGILYGINQHNASLILFDRFSLPNYNSVTFATSGAGKSYAMKLEVLRSLMIGVNVIVIDPEREFERLAQATGGRSFNVSLNSEHHINPFDLPPVGEDENPSDVLRSTIINLVGFFRVLLGSLTQEEESIIDRAIRETYALKDITASSDFSSAEPPLISDFALVLAGIEGGGEELSERLERYTKGSWAGFINQPTNVNMNRQFVVFSIRDMEEELKTAAMYIITRYVWNNIRKELKKRLLVVDEAWIMMQAEDTASFLFGLVKRGRKYYLGVATITQDVSDFLRSRFGRPILNNSSLVLLLRQSPTSIDLIQEVFNLTDGEKFLLLESAVGEGLFIAGLKRVAIRIVASFTEDAIITTDPSQLLKKERMNDV